MIGVLICMILTGFFGDNSSPTAAELIEKLGSPRYADREAAGAGLEKLGRRAMPDLVKNRQARDPEIRSRTNLLIRKIEASILLEGTPVPLDVKDRPLREVVAAIGGRGGPQVEILAGPDRVAGDRRLTLPSEKSLPFWTAIDHLCEAGGFGYRFPTTAGVGDSGRKRIMLVPGGDRPAGLNSDRGPFRVNLMSLHYQRDLNFGGTATSSGVAAFPRPPGGRPGLPVNGQARGQGVTEQFTIRLQMVAEPDLSLSQTGPLRVVEAVDDLGQSLMPPDSIGPPAGFHPSYGAQSPLQFQVGLRRPERPGRAIRVLRGAIPVSVAARQPGPLIIPLGGAAGREFKDENATLIIHQFRPSFNSDQASLDLTVRPQPDRTIEPEQGDPDLPLRRPEYGPLQIDLLDDAGLALTWYVSAVQVNGDETRLTLSILPGRTPATARPATLRFHGIVRAQAEVPFDFRDVPMP